MLDNLPTLNAFLMSIKAINIEALWLSIELSTVSTLLLLFLCLPAATLLNQLSPRWRSISDTIVALPLVLPSSVLGFYLLIAFSPNNFLGQFLLEHFGIHLAFSFNGLVIGSMIYSLPFVLQPLQQHFSQLDNTPYERAIQLGWSRWQRFLHITLSQSKQAIIMAFALGFAHTLGEFGIVLMIGGNIPGETQVASIAIYEQVEALNYDQANIMAMILMGLSIAILWPVYRYRAKNNHPQRASSGWSL